MKRKKECEVLYIITKLELGGAQKVCLSLFKNLPTHGFKTSLISGSEGLLTKEVKQSSNVLLLDHFKREISLRTIWHEISCFLKLVLYLHKRKKKGLRIVHTHSTKAGILGRWAAFFAGIHSRIHTIHGYAFHEYQSYPVWLAIYTVELLTSLITTHYICVSSKDAQTGCRIFPKFKYKHSIIRAAVDWNQFIPAQQSNMHSHKPFIFGTIACFKKQKNIFDLLQAFAYAKKYADIRLEVIGDGILRTAIEKWIQTHKLEQTITLHGWQDSVAPIMRQWHAFVLSSLWEGLPCAIVEARLLRLPILSYNTGGIRDIITHGENGLLYKPKDWINLAKGMASISKSHQLYTKLKSTHENLHDFHDQQMIKQHVHLYRKIV